MVHSFGLVMVARWAASSQARAAASPGRGFGKRTGPPSWLLPMALVRTLTDPDALLAACFDMLVGPSELSEAERAVQPEARRRLTRTGRFLAAGEAESAATEHRLDLGGPCTTSSSRVIGRDEWAGIWQHVPIRFQLKRVSRPSPAPSRAAPRLNPPPSLQAMPIFSTATHGYRLQSLLEACDASAPTILLVQTTLGDRFGAFCSYPWSVSTRPGQLFFGSGSTFVFRLCAAADRADAAGEPETFLWVGFSGAAHADGTGLFMMANPDGLAIGGGGDGYALWLDSDLHLGSSARCTTFDNAPLCTSGPDFTVANVEVWGFGTDGGAAAQRADSGDGEAIP